MLQEVARAAYAMNGSLTFADPGNIRARFPYRRKPEGPVIGAFRFSDGGSAEIRNQRLPTIEARICWPTALRERLMGTKWEHFGNRQIAESPESRGFQRFSAWE